MKSFEVLALIPARGGSKGIPRKNIREFAGFPLIAYSIAAGLQAEEVSRVIVSTDDAEIASVAKRFNADVPFMRPKEFAQDDTPDLPVFQHALRWLAENENYEPDIVVQLRPTSPLRKLTHINSAVAKLRNTPEADSIRTVCEPFQNPFKMWQIDNKGFMKPLIKQEWFEELKGVDEPYNIPHQQLPKTYWQTGYVDAAWTRTIVEKKSMTGEKILPLEIEAGDWVDIDSPDDWEHAEALLASMDNLRSALGFEIAEV